MNSARGFRRYRIKRSDMTTRLPLRPANAIKRSSGIAFKRSVSCCLNYAGICCLCNLRIAPEVRDTFPHGTPFDIFVLVLFILLTKDLEFGRIITMKAP
uniref:Uncharacterized protein n=1 Tax=Candidatus Kentrum sp. MB TaxID=2138164 RepID=A0A451BCI9_9GAMM|nr:MAG: hypothetical protein BECKMB1821G_GA0114241_1001107 [Candidatus Kentron sp. MB]VFK32633.1 MAG: hypothetical protein BECKMB1821I_GA0114274_103527 [Candidatus Kentron sp. MB]VFK76007.1 MAG: hypothetical protein BECKMB1821H_GA0114242_103826 [Candidatus Kentron sp. MB]